MADDYSNGSDGAGDDDFRVTHLTPRRPPASGSTTTRQRWRDTWMWRWAPLALGVVALAALIVSALPSGSDALGALLWMTHRSATATPVTSSEIVSGDIQVGAATAADLRDVPAPSLAPAPATCATGKTPHLTHVGPPSLGEAIGAAPVWLAGFTGAYPTLRLGAAASASAYGWSAPYTRYGWPAPIGLVVQPGYAGQIVLFGRDSTGHPVVFGFVQAGVWGAPASVTAAFALDTGHPSIPAGGSDTTGDFWYGYVFLPHAGCYTLAATWPGGSWSVIVSAGR